jgi:hypothetical protein
MVRAPWLDLPTATYDDEFLTSKDFQNDATNQVAGLMPSTVAGGITVRFAGGVSQAD